MIPDIDADGVRLRALLGKGRAHMRLGEIDTASSCIVSASKIDTDDPAERADKALALFELGRAESGSRLNSNYDKLARSLLEEIGSRSARASSALGFIYRHLAELDPNSAAHLPQKVLYSQAAMEDYLRIRNGGADNRSRAHADPKYLEMALGEFDEAIRQESDKAVHYYNAGMICYKLSGTIGDAGESSEMLKKAASYFRKAAALNPEDISARKRLAQINAQLGDYLAAARDYQRVLENGRADEEVWNGYGKVLAKCGKLDRARKYFEKVLAADPKNTLAWNRKGKVLLEQGGLEEAISCFEQASKIDNECLAAVYNKAQAYLKKHERGDTSGAGNAMTLFMELKEKDPKNPKYCVGLGRAYELQGTAGKQIIAIEHYDAALMIDPDYTPAQKGKARVERILDSSDPNKTLLLELPEWQGESEAPNANLPRTVNGSSSNKRNSVVTSDRASVWSLD